jgi:hypothetical protein
MAARRRDPDFRAWVGVGGWGKISVCYPSQEWALVALADEQRSKVAAARLCELWVTRQEAAGLIQDADEFGWYRYCPLASSSPPSSNGNDNGAA